MNGNRVLETRLQALLSTDPTTAPAGLLERSLDDVRGARQRRAGVLRLVSWPSARARVAPLLVAVALAAAIPLGFLGGGVATPTPSPAPSPTQGARMRPPAASLPAGMSPTAVFDLSAPSARTCRPELYESACVPANRWLTSSTFGRPILFWVDTFGNNPASPSGDSPSDWCLVETGDHWLSLEWKMACRWNVRILLPDGVACGSAPVRPTADQLAAAITAKGSLHAADLGPIGDQLDDGVLFSVPPSGHWVVVHGGRPLDATAVNPDGCVVTAGTDRWEVRADIPQTLLLFDVGGELVIIRLADAQDGPTALGADGTLSLASTKILSTIHDLTIR